jgi:hypothetical protein
MGLFSRKKPVEVPTDLGPDMAVPDPHTRVQPINPNPTSGGYAATPNTLIIWRSLHILARHITPILKGHKLHNQRIVRLHNMTNGGHVVVLVVIFQWRAISERILSAV